MSTTLDAAAKQRIKDALLARAQENLASTEENADVQSEAAEVVRDDIHTRDDEYQAEQSGDMTELLDDAADKRTQDIETLEQLDVSPADEVRPGAVVRVGAMSYLVGIVAEDIEVDGETYAGLSTESPLYEAIQGKKVGQQVTVNDRTQRITMIA